MNEARQLKLNPKLPSSTKKFARPSLEEGIFGLDGATLVESRLPHRGHERRRIPWCCAGRHQAEKQTVRSCRDLERVVRRSRGCWAVSNRGIVREDRIFAILIRPDSPAPRDRRGGCCGIPCVSIGTWGAQNYGISAVNSTSTIQQIAKGRYFFIWFSGI